MNRREVEVSSSSNNNNNNNKRQQNKKSPNRQLSLKPAWARKGAQYWDWDWTRSSSVGSLALDKPQVDGVFCDCDNKAYKTLPHSQNQQHLPSYNPIVNNTQQQQQQQHHLHLSSSNNKNNYNYKNKMAHFKIVAFFVCAVVLFVLSTKSAEAAIARVKFSNPSYPGKCVLNSNVIMAPGQTGKAPDHLCAGVTCLENGYVEFRTCQAKAPPKGCKQRDFVNTNRNYPECCERSYDCTKHI